MKIIQIHKNANLLNRVECSCGYYGVSDNSENTDYLAYIHSLKHARIKVEEYHDGVLVDPNRKRAIIGKNRGRTIGALE